MDQTQIYNYLQDNMDSPKSQYTTTRVLNNKKSPPLEGGHFKKWWHVDSET